MNIQRGISLPAAMEGFGCDHMKENSIYWRISFTNTVRYLKNAAKM
jgi:hypothetical protein